MADKDFILIIMNKIDEAGFFFFAAFFAPGNVFQIFKASGPAEVLPGAEQALRVFRRADTGAKIHYRRGIVGRTCPVGQRFGFLANQSGDFVNGFGQIIEPADDANDVAVDDGFGLIESQSQKAGNGVTADAFEFEHFLPGLGKFSAVLADDDACRRMQRTGSGIIAKSLPVKVNFFQRRFGQTLNRGKTLHKTPKVGNDGFDGGPLEHEFRNKDDVWIGMSAAPDPPRQVAAVFIIPAQQQF